MRIEDEEPLTLAPLDAIRVAPTAGRQLFNDTGADALWLVVERPRS